MAASQQNKEDNQPLATYHHQAVVYLSMGMLEQVFGDQMSFLTSTSSD